MDESSIEFTDCRESPQSYEATYRPEDDVFQQALDSNPQVENVGTVDSARDFSHHFNNTTTSEAIPPKSQDGTSATIINCEHSARITFPPLSDPGLVPSICDSVVSDLNGLRLIDGVDEDSHDVAEIPCTAPRIFSRSNPHRAARPTMRAKRKLLNGDQLQEGWPSKKLRLPQSEEGDVPRLCIFNKAMLMECHEENCFIEARHRDTGSEERCCNRPITLLDSDENLCIARGPCGESLQTRVDINQDEVIVEYKGRILTQSQLATKSERTCRYVYALRKNFKRNLFIDAHKEATWNKARYANHSCNPNCRMEEWNANGFIRVVLVADRNIKANEHLTFDYYDSIMRFEEVCLCGSSNCRSPPNNSLLGPGDEIQDESCICDKDGAGISCGGNSCIYKTFPLACIG